MTNKETYSQKEVTQSVRDHFNRFSEAIRRTECLVNNEGFSPKSAPKVRFRAGFAGNSQNFLGSIKFNPKDLDNSRNKRGEFVKAHEAAHAAFGDGYRVDYLLSPKIAAQIECRTKWMQALVAPESLEWHYATKGKYKSKYAQTVDGDIVSVSQTLKRATKVVKDSKVIPGYEPAPIDMEFEIGTCAPKGGEEGWKNFEQFVDKYAVELHKASRKERPYVCTGNPSRDETVSDSNQDASDAGAFVAPSHTFDFPMV